MARSLRIQFNGAFYHVTSRGNERKKIFLSGSDYAKFLSYMSDALEKYGVLLHAYALMGTHYHLIVETPSGNLSTFMHGLGSAYTTYFNIKRQRSGHLFQGRYKALLVDAESYLLELSRYIHLNPARAGMVQHPEEYPHSSYRSYLHPKEKTPVTRELIWGMITRESRKAPQRYREFVESALDGTPTNPFEKVYGGLILGKMSFIKEVLRRVKGKGLENQETAQRRVLTATTSNINDIINVLSSHFSISREKAITSSPYKTYAVYLTRKHTPLSNKQIGSFFGGISYSAVTKIGTRLKQRMATDGRLRSDILDMGKKLSRVKG